VQLVIVKAAASAPDINQSTFIRTDYERTVVVSLQVRYFHSRWTTVLSNQSDLISFVDAMAIELK
jgi:hypothetical protein